MAGENDALAKDEAAFQFLWEEYERRLKEEQKYNEETVEIFPEPGFVIKTRDLKTGKKVFINVLQCDKVPAPHFQMEANQPEDEQRTRVPLSCADPRDDVDHCECLGYLLCNQEHKLIQRVSLSWPAMPGVRLRLEHRPGYTMQ